MALRILVRLLLCVIMFAALIADVWATMVYCGRVKNWIWVRDCIRGLVRNRVAIEEDLDARILYSDGKRTIVSMPKNGYMFDAPWPGDYLTFGLSFRKTMHGTRHYAAIARDFLLSWSCDESGACRNVTIQHGGKLIHDRMGDGETKMKPSVPLYNRPYRSGCYTVEMR